MSAKKDKETNLEVKTLETAKDDEKEGKLTVGRDSPFSLFQGMDRFFDEFFNDSYWPFSRKQFSPFKLALQKWDPLFRAPLVNIHETDDYFDLTAEIPGIKKGDIELTIKDGTLEIKGESKEEKTVEKEGRLVRNEYRSSKYYRTFELPEYIDENNIEANLDKGVLSIKLPKLKPKETKEKKIAIQ